MNQQAIIRCLKEQGLIRGRKISLTPLKGGVSSDIYLLEDGSSKFVVKQALPRLRVPDEWLADTSRNLVEQSFVRYARGFLPDAVLPVRAADPQEGFFIMDYLEGGFVTWKQQLLRGEFNERTARKAAELIATLHQRSWNDPEARRIFQTRDNFRALRIDPYLVAAGDRNPALRSWFHEEAERLYSSRQALVHGDFSPKNLMVSGDRLILLDHEVAWFGDPAFDLAFCLTHLYLKSLLHPNNPEGCLDLCRAAWESYFAVLGPGPERRSEMEARIVRLLLMLLLARIDGKSQVEYLAGKAEQRRFVRRFVSDMLPSGEFRFEAIHPQWTLRLRCA